MPEGNRRGRHRSGAVSDEAAGASEPEPKKTRSEESPSSSPVSIVNISSVAVGQVHLNGNQPHDHQPPGTTSQAPIAMPEVPHQPPSLLETAVMSLINQQV